jgi:tetratricopeptide (TPR) repeat protein
MRAFQDRLRSILSELRRRKIFRAAAVYAAVAFVVLQAAAIVLPALHLPEWSLTLLVVLAIFGFPLVLALEWVYEISSEGVRREDRPRSDAEAAVEGVRDADGAPPRGLARRLAFPALGAAVLVFVVLGLGLRGGGPSLDVSESDVAVLPFSVRGGEEALYLGQGIVTLLGTALDGAGTLRAVDARATFGTLAQHGGGVPELGRGRTVALRLGAALYVLGDIVQHGDRLHMDAALYRVGDGAEPRARSSVSGPTDALFELVDELAAGLLAGLGGASGDRMMQTAAMTTSSLDALKAYIDGEGRLRSGQFEQAGEAFLHAVELDSTFALAHYRLALASEWGNLPGIIDLATAAAVRHASRLSARDRALVEAYHAWQSGDAVEAERRYRAIVARYPEDVEAWFQLGEVLFHYGPLRGRRVAESEEAWNQVLRYEPLDLFAVVHIARIVAGERRPASLGPLLARFPAGYHTDRRFVQARLLGEIAARDTAGVLRTAREVRQWEGPAMSQLGSYATAFTREHGLVQLLLRELDGEHLSADVRAGLKLNATMLHLAVGKWSAARSELDVTLAVQDGALPRLTSLLALTAPLPHEPSEMARLFAEFEATARAPPPVSPMAGPTGAAVGEAITAYCLGLLALRVDQPASARSAASDLAILAAAPEAVPVMRDLERGLRARLAWHEGRPLEALRVLEEVELGETYNLAASVPFFARVHERFLRGKVLASLGRGEEALSWFGSLAEFSFTGQAFFGPALLAQAEIYEGLGENGQATEYYAQFLEAWKDADPGFDARVSHARERYEALTAAGGPQ